MKRFSSTNTSKLLNYYWGVKQIDLSICLKLLNLSLKKLGKLFKKTS